MEDPAEIQVQAELDFFFIFRLHVPTHAACVLWISSMSYGSADITNNIAEYGGARTWSLARKDRRVLTPECHWGQCSCAFATLHTEPSTKAALGAVFTEASVIANYINVSIWGQH